MKENLKKDTLYSYILAGFTLIMAQLAYIVPFGVVVAGVAYAILKKEVINLGVLLKFASAFSIIPAWIFTTTVVSAAGKEKFIAFFVFIAIFIIFGSTFFYIANSIAVWFLKLFEK